MRNLKLNFNTLIIGITSFISFDSYRRLLEKEYSVNQSEVLLQDTARRSNEILERLNRIDQMLEKNKANTEDLDKKLNDVNNKIENLGNDNVFDVSKVNKEEIIESLDGRLDKMNDIVNNLYDYIKSINSGNDFIENHFINSLNSTQLGAVSYIILSILIIYFLINILLSFY